MIGTSATVCNIITTAFSDQYWGTRELDPTCLRKEHSAHSSRAITARTGHDFQGDVRGFGLADQRASSAWGQPAGDEAQLCGSRYEPRRARQKACPGTFFRVGGHGPRPTAQAAARGQGQGLLLPLPRVLPLQNIRLQLLARRRSPHVRGTFWAWVMRFKWDNFRPFPR